MIDRIIGLPDPKFHNNNIKYIIKILLKNNYPLKFKFNTIRTRIKYHLHKHNNGNNDDNNKEITRVCSIPYIKNFSNKIANLLTNSGFKITYSCNNKLNTFIKPNKDPLLHMQNSYLVYKIQCLVCQATYIEQTKKQLKTRIKEHKQNINGKTNSLTVISEHIQYRPQNRLGQY